MLYCIVRPKKKVRVGRSDFFLAKRDFVDKIGGKFGLQTKNGKNCENSAFRVIFVEIKIY